MKCNRCDLPATHQVQVEDRVAMSCNRHTRSTLQMAAGFHLFVVSTSLEAVLAEEARKEAK